MTAYEIHISDWSSDVCSSDLVLADYPVFVRLVVLRDRHARDRQRGRAHACDNSESSFASHVPFHLLHKGRGVGRAAVRSEARRVGKECVSKWRSRWSTDQ